MLELLSGRVIEHSRNRTESLQKLHHAFASGCEKQSRKRPAETRTNGKRQRDRNHNGPRQAGEGIAPELSPTTGGLGAAGLVGGLVLFCSFLRRSSMVGLPRGSPFIRRSTSSRLSVS